MQTRFPSAASRAGAGRKLVRSYASLASLAAAGTSVVPTPFVIGAELAGLDPFRRVQRRMIAEIGARYGRDLSFMAHRQSALANGYEYARPSRGLARKLAPKAGKVRYLSTLVRQPERYVPIVGALLVGGYAYWDTWRLGMACLEAVGIPKT